MINIIPINAENDADHYEVFYQDKVLSKRGNILPVSIIRNDDD